MCRVCVLCVVLLCAALDPYMRKLKNQSIINIIIIMIMIMTTVFLIFAERREK